MSLALAEPETAAVDLARESVYRFLSAVLSDPRGARFQLGLDPVVQQLACHAADLLRHEVANPARLGLGELPAEALTLKSVCEHLQLPLGDIRAKHDLAFGMAAARECPPFETEYHPNSDPFFRSQQMADVAGFYRAFGLRPSADLPERPDHVALELEFMAFVLMKKRLASPAPDAIGDSCAVCDDAQRSFFQDHLAWWIPTFAAGLRRKSVDGLYPAVGRVLAALVHAERRRLGVDTPSVPGLQDRGDTPEEPGVCGGCG